MEKSVEQLIGELRRLEQCDEALTTLLRHHQSQRKRQTVCSKAWHEHLCELIWEAKGKKW